MKPSHEAEVSVSLTNSLLDTAVEAGLDRQQLLLEADIDHNLLSNPDNRIPFLLQEKLWHRIIQLRPERPIGLEVGLKTQPGSFNILGYIAMNSANLGEAFAHVLRYQNLVGEGGTIEQRAESNGTLTISYAPRHPQHPCTHHRVAAILASWINMGRWLVKEFAVEKLSFTDSAPPDSHQYQRQLGCSVHFDALENAMVIKTALLEYPIRQANSTLCQLLQTQADKLIEQSQQTSVSRQVIAYISQQLMGSEPDKKAIASALNISARTLQRKLEDEGTSYKQLLNDTRHKLALEYLARPELNSSEISFMLGFSESSTFYRAFKKWTGLTPGQYRHGLQPTDDTTC